MTVEASNIQRRPFSSSLERKERLLRVISDQLIWFILIILFITTTLIDSRFLSQANIVNVLVHSSALGILVIGECLCLIHGKFDLSIEATLGFTAMLGAILVLEHGLNPYFAIVLMLATGGVIGLLNSQMILRFKIDPFVVTLGTQIVFRGLTLVISGGYTRYNFPQEFRMFAANVSGGILSVPIFLMLASYLVFHIILSRRVFGRQLYAVGGNSEAARVAGINVNRVVTLAFVLSGVLATVGGFVLSARLNSAQTTLGEGMVFEVFAAAVIGGVSLQGGRGNLIGALGGVLLVSSIDSALTLTRVSAFWVQTSKGLILLAAVFLDTLKLRIIPVIRERWIEKETS